RTHEAGSARRVGGGGARLRAADRAVCVRAAGDAAGRNRHRLSRRARLCAGDRAARAGVRRRRGAARVSAVGVPAGAGERAGLGAVGRRGGAPRLRAATDRGRRVRRDGGGGGADHGRLVPPRADFARRRMMDAAAWVEGALLAAAVALTFAGVAAAWTQANALKRVIALAVAGLGAAAALAALGAPAALVTAGVAATFATLALGAALAVRLQESYGTVELVEIDAA